MADKVIDWLGIVRSYDKKFSKRLFSYRPYVKPSVDNWPRLLPRRLSTRGRCENSRV